MRGILGSTSHGVNRKPSRALSVLSIIDVKPAGLSARPGTTSTSAEWARRLSMPFCRGNVVRRAIHGRSMGLFKCGQLTVRDSFLGSFSSLLSALEKWRIRRFIQLIIHTLVIEPDVFVWGLFS